MLGYVGNVGIFCLAPGGRQVLSQCWDMLGYVGIVGNLASLPEGTRRHPNVGICWDVLEMLGYPASPSVGAR